MQSHESRLSSRWLVAVSTLIIVFGVLLAFFHRTAPFDRLFNQPVDAAFWSEAPPLSVRRFQTWAYGVLGGTVAGWSALLTCVAAGPFRRGEPWAWTAVAASTCGWYVIDTALSLAFGVWFNVALNTLVLVAVGVPLVATWRSCRGS